MPKLVFGRSVSRLKFAALAFVLLGESTSFVPSRLQSTNSVGLPSFPVTQRDDVDNSSGMDEDPGAHRWADPMRQKRSRHWIVLVDDEEAIRRAVGQLLFDKGYQVTTACDGATALDVARNGDRKHPSLSSSSQMLPSVMVCDVRMPGMDGLQLLEEIRSDPTLVGIPVVLLTAKGMTQDRIAGYEAGADVYIPKPFDPEELVTVVDSVIARYEALNGQNIEVEDLQRDLNEIKHLLLQKGGGGVGNGWVQATNVFLAPDERQVLELVCQGLMNKEIGQKCFLSTSRVEQLLTGMFRKAKVKNRTELVRWAVTTGNVKI